MVEKLIELNKNAYSPYYNFNVSAIIVTKDLKEFVGVNVENINGTSICAERNAIHNAISNGYKKGDFKELNIMVNSDKISTPCFSCRQVMLEFFDEDSIIRCFNKNGEYKEYKLKELCPYPFEGEDIK